MKRWVKRCLPVMALVFCLSFSFSFDSFAWGGYGGGPSWKEDTGSFGGSGGSRYYDSVSWNRMADFLETYRNKYFSFDCPSVSDLLGHLDKLWDLFVSYTSSVVRAPIGYYLGSLFKCSGYADIVYVPYDVLLEFQHDLTLSGIFTDLDVHGTNNPGTYFLTFNNSDSAPIWQGTFGSQTMYFCYDGKLVVGIDYAGEVQTNKLKYAISSSADSINAAIRNSTATITNAIATLSVGGSTTTSGSSLITPKYFRGFFTRIMPNPIWKGFSTTNNGCKIYLDGSYLKITGTCSGSYSVRIGNYYNFNGSYAFDGLWQAAADKGFYTFLYGSTARETYYDYGSGVSFDENQSMAINVYVPAGTYNGYVIGQPAIYQNIFDYWGTRLVSAINSLPAAIADLIPASGDTSTSSGGGLFDKTDTAPGSSSFVKQLWDSISSSVADGLSDLVGSIISGFFKILTSTLDGITDTISYLVGNSLDLSGFFESFADGGSVFKIFKYNSDFVLPADPQEVLP